MSADATPEKGNASATGATSESKGGGRFGTFGGVFTPSILTILGVVMYMLVGRVTGEAGLGGMLLIVVAAHAISLATGLSVASISTNRTVGAGGAYFMISRSLGGAAGAAIGIPLFLAQSLSVTFYIVGFSEALHPLIPASYASIIDPLVISTAINIGLTMLSMKSADLAIKAQYVVMAAILLSLVSFFSGTTPSFPQEIEWFNPEGRPFGTLFAIFFPAVTGIMAGVGMSGDLRDGRKSLPRGTLAAILVGFVIYLAFPVWLALNFDNAFLALDGQNPDVEMAVWSVSRWPQLIYLGVWGATLSSALGSILTAPRTLQALGMDGLVPTRLAQGSGPNNEPRVGTMLTFVIAQAGIFLGSLDAIAPLLTMFFLATYGFTNLACGLQKWAGSPSYRPSFKTPAIISLAGAGACFYVMSIISLPAMLGSMFLCGVIFVIVERRDLGTTWGDSRHGIWSALVHYALQRLRRAEYHPQNWRPNLVIAGGDPDKRRHLLELGNELVQNRGIVTYFHLLRGKVEELVVRRKALQQDAGARLAADFPNVFYRVDIVDDVYEGAVQVAQSYGMGSFESNTVLAGWPKKAHRLSAYFSMCRDLASLDRSLLLVHWNEDREFGERASIHVWWGGLEGNGGLMLLLAFLLKAHGQWRGAKVQVNTVVRAEAEHQSAESALKEVLEAARLDAEARVIVRDGRPIHEIMREESGSADLAILGFRIPPHGGELGAFHERMNRMLEVLPTTMLVRSARSFEGEPLLFDEQDAPRNSMPDIPVEASAEGMRQDEEAVRSHSESPGASQEAVDETADDGKSASPLVVGTNHNDEQNDDDGDKEEDEEFPTGFGDVES